MKISGRNIKRRLYGLRKLPSNLKRARYFRGHGVHSPFVYAVVRQVFMRSRLFPEGATDLYYELLARGISQRRAVQLQNLMTHCGYESFDIDNSDMSAAVRYDDSDGGRCAGETQRYGGTCRGVWLYALHNVTGGGPQPRRSVSRNCRGTQVHKYR